MSPLVAARAAAAARGYGWGLSAGGPSGAFESIATVTAAGGETSLSFTNIPQTYVALQIRGISKTTDTGVTGAYAVSMQINSDTGSNYAYHLLWGNGSSAFATGTTSTQIHHVGRNPTSLSLANIYGATIIDIHDYASTTRNKTVRAFTGADANLANTDFFVGLTSGLWVSTAAVTSLTLTAVGLQFAAGTKFALYGIKGAS